MSSPPSTESLVARQRHLVREQILDESTRHAMRDLGVDAGWKCLEVGAGHLSIACWLADEVGLQGRVVATDLDERFLVETGRPNLELRRHNIQTDPLEEATFDLVHCRTLLMHLPDPAAVIPRMVRALKPGGWLLLEEPDFATFGALDPSHPMSLEFQRVTRGMLAAWGAAGLLHLDLGRRLPPILAALRLEEVASEGTSRVWRGGEPGAKFYCLGLDDVIAGPQPPPGVTGAGELVLMKRALQDPSFWFQDYTLFTVSARRPETGDGS